MYVFPVHVHAFKDNSDDTKNSTADMEVCEMFFFQCHITATCSVSDDKTSFNPTLFIYYTAFYQLHKKKKFHNEWCVGEKSTLR